MKSRIVLLALCLTLLMSGLAFAAPITDIAQSPTGYFVPDSASTYDSPYYRWYGEDWGWQHNAYTGFTTATLSISAFDVDNENPSYAYGEHDLIEVFDSGSWISLGELNGASDIYSYTTFNLGNSLFDDIATGLQVRLIIDSANVGWAVTLAKSVLSLDDGTIPDPNPNPTPEPSTLALAALGLAGAFCLRRKFKN